jgi:prepilin-type N-terminal cleavage/methylation domain-containing protein
MRLNKSEQGVSLIEIILVVAIIVILSAITLPIQNTVLTNNYLSDGLTNIQVAIRTASLHARLATDGLSAGVWVGKTEDGRPEVISYRGESFEKRNKEYDLLVEVAKSLEVSATPGGDIHFNKVSGTTDYDTIITISSLAGKKILKVNTLGIVSEEKDEKKP